MNKLNYKGYFFMCITLIAKVLVMNVILNCLH